MSPQSCSQTPLPLPHDISGKSPVHMAAPQHSSAHALHCWDKLKGQGGVSFLVLRTCSSSPTSPATMSVILLAGWLFENSLRLSALTPAELRAKSGIALVMTKAGCTPALHSSPTWWLVLTNSNNRKVLNMHYVYSIKAASQQQLSKQHISKPCRRVQHPPRQYEQCQPVLLQRQAHLGTG